MDASCAGSSPLTRGKRRDRTPPRRSCRLIPAHAGKTCKRTCVARQETAHPRSRGENFPSRHFRSCSPGSSPLTRGKPFNLGATKTHRRLIPAHAGKTNSQAMRHQMVKAHPRSRGENPTIADRKRRTCGSSPLTRGKHFLTCAFIAQIDQILESLELCASSGSYSLMDAYATDAPQDRVRSIGLAPLSSRGAS